MLIGAPKMIVSGLARYDAFGRVKEAFYPVVEDLTNKANFNTAFDNSLLPTITTYDILDRVTKTRLPDDTETNFAYSIMNGLLKTTVIDARNNKQETFANGSGLTVKSLQYKHINPDTVLTTLFEYDDVNQLKKVTDDAVKSTESLYDWAGNRTQVKHPASGTITFGYDPAGNTLWKYTANKDSINYGYEYNRLTTISYPRHPENNVVYTYGLAQNTDNRAGRLVGIEDGSGAQEFKYGRQGEVTEVRRTLVIPNQGVASYVTKTEYDSWNRLLKMTYPDGEVVNYTYNTGGLLAGVTGNKGSETTNYVTDIRYDKFEQRSYLKYGNGAETNYTYKPDNRLLNTLSVQKGTAMLMNNAYTYDDVQNITRVINTGSTSNSIGGQMEHRYYYDNLYRLDSASGDFIGNNGKKARYRLSMEYDNMHNITRKKQDIVQNDLKFTGILNAGYDLSYTYADNSQQIANIADQSYRVERSSQATYQTGSQTGDAISSKAQTFTYDANGNMTFVASGRKLNDSTLQATSTRTMLWDEENRLLGISDNGYVSNYWYDAAGERTVKQSGGSEGVFVNGVLSGARTETNKFTAYVSPYLVVSNGGNYTKHIYMGSQRITSKVSNSGVFTSRNPLTDTTALNKSYTAKLASLTDKIKERFDSLGVVYNGTPQTGGLISSNPATTASSYFYHSDHLGSSSLITDGTGALVQHIEYVPFGETFIDERNGNWSTPYLFNGKEKDEETGLHYFHARYYDSRLGVWLSVDRLAEKYPNVGSYVYCFNNPLMYIDPNGMAGIPAYLLKGTLAHSTFTAHMRVRHAKNPNWMFNLNIIGLKTNFFLRPDALYDNLSVGGVWELKPAPPAFSSKSATVEAKIYARQANIANDTERFQVGSQGGAPLPFEGVLIVTEKSTNTVFRYSIPDPGSGAIFWEDITSQKQQQENPAPSNVPVFNFEVNLNWQRVVENTTVTAGVAATGYMVLKVLEKALNIATKPIMPIFVVPINTNFENYNTNEEL